MIFTQFVTSAAAGDVDVGSAVADVERGGGVERRHAGCRAVLVPLQSVLLLLHLKNDILMHQLKL